MFVPYEYDAKFHTDTKKAKYNRPDDGGSNNLWNLGKLLPGYRMQHYRGKSSFYYLYINLCFFSAVDRKTNEYELTIAFYEFKLFL
jgi:hypothetical protein